MVDLLRPERRRRIVPERRGADRRGRIRRRDRGVIEAMLRRRARWGGGGKRDDDRNLAGVRGGNVVGREEKKAEDQLLKESMC